MRPSVHTMPVDPLRPRWVVLDVVGVAEAGHWFEAHVEHGHLLQDAAGNLQPKWCEVARLTGIAQLQVTGFGIFRFRVGLHACRCDARHLVEAFVSQCALRLAAEALAQEAAEAQGEVSRG